MEAAGDPRDWFRYGDRLRAYERAWAEFMDARRRRRFDTGFEWNQILVLGDYGAGKTSLAIKMALYWSPVIEQWAPPPALRCTANRRTRRASSTTDWPEGAQGRASTWVSRGPWRRRRWGARRHCGGGGYGGLAGWKNVAPCRFSREVFVAHWGVREWLGMV